MIEIFQRQQDPKCLQKICNRRLPVQGSISQPFRTVLSRDNGLMLPLQRPSYPSFLQLVEGTEVRLPHPCGKLLPGQLRLLQAE